MQMFKRYRHVSQFKDSLPVEFLTLRKDGNRIRVRYSNGVKGWIDVESLIARAALLRPR